MVPTACPGDGRSGGARRRLPRLGFGRAAERERGRWRARGKEIGTRGRRAGGSPGRRPHPRGEQEVAGVGLPAQGTQLPAWLRKRTRAFCQNPLGFGDFSGDFET
jgi:hypothetical protein